MKQTRLIVSICGVLAFVAAPMPRAVGQAVSPPPSQRAPASEDPVTLNPYEVSADKDNSYGALQSNSLTAFKMDLAKAPVTAQVFTQTFMDDINATTIEGVLLGYAGTVGGASNNDQSAMQAEPGDRGSGASLAIRGVPINEIKRDGFIGPPNNMRTSTGSTSNYSVERVEVIEGPQSLLYGSVSGGGVINSVSKRAAFNQQKGSFKLVADSFGGLRGLLDANYGLKKVAVRIASSVADEKTVRKNIGDKFFGLYTQVAVQLLPSTTLRLQTEKASADARVTGAPSLDNFMATTDPRRGKNTRYLALTGTLDDLHVLDGHLDYYNVDSLAAWFSTEKIATQYSALALESRLPAGFSMQVRGMYNDTLDERFTNGGSNASALPARGLPNSAGNPFNVSAMRIGGTDGTNVRLNRQQDRNRGVQVSLLHEADINLFGWRGRSQSSLGGQGYHRGPTFLNNGIDTIYYRADANWQPIINPAIALDYGRVPLDFVYFPIQGGVPKEPLFKPGATKIVVNGVNYVLMPRIYADDAHKSPTNPFGIIPNNANAANPNRFSGQWARGGETHNKSMYAANFTDWAGGRLTTLFGYSLMRMFTSNIQSSSTGTNNVETPHMDSVGWQVGVNYAVRPWLRVYAVEGTSGRSEAMEGSANDIYGNPLKYTTAKSPYPEVGLKLNTLDGRYAAQFNFNPKSEVYNERRSAGDVGGQNLVNPNGINGRAGLNTGNRVNVDRSLSSEAVTFTADPTKNWRMRVSASHLDGKILSDAIYPVVYNDQFYTRGNNVTYADGTSVLINPAGTGTPNTPLTITMINDPTSRYYASPDPTNGSITNANLRTALTTADPIRGRAATGALGLPISAIQYNFTAPYPGGVYPIYRASDLNTGFNEYTFNAQNHNTFSEGFLKGFGVFEDVQTYLKNRAYYVTTPGKERYLYRLPSVTVFNIGLSYKRKLTERYVWSTQLNVRNILNHYKVLVMPSSGNGTQLLARLSAQPRSFTWSNSISF